MRNINIKEWIKKVERHLNTIKNYKTTDRLSTVSGITQCVSCIGGSVNGWISWLSDPRIMNSFNEDELIELFNEFKRLSIKMLELDIEWTKKKLNKKKEIEYIK